MLDIRYDRRDFMRVGGLGAGLGMVPFSDLAMGQENVISTEGKSVVWLWLGGGPTQFETFHATPDDVPGPFQPVAGTATHPNGLVFGGLFKELIKRGDKLTAVNSFSHGDSSHR